MSGWLHSIDHFPGKARRAIQAHKDMFGQARLDDQPPVSRGIHRPSIIRSVPAE